MKQISCPTCGHVISIAAESRKISYYLCQKCGGKVAYERVGLLERLFGQKKTSGFRTKGTLSNKKDKQPPEVSTELGKVKSLLIMANRNPSGPGATWGPQHDTLVQKVLTIVNSGSVKGNQVLVYSHPDCQPTDDTTVLTMRLLTLCPLHGFPMNVERVRFFPFRLDEASGVAAVEFE